MCKDPLGATSNTTPHNKHQILSAIHNLPRTPLEIERFLEVLINEFFEQISKLSQ